jgi:hypothetical protein
VASEVSSQAKPRGARAWRRAEVTTGIWAVRNSGTPAASRASIRAWSSPVGSGRKPPAAR